MADGVADDDKGTKEPMATGSPASSTDWTISDRRGPLKPAAPMSDGAPVSEIERIVPGSETDAEGAHDAIILPEGTSGVPSPIAASSTETHVDHSETGDPAVGATSGGAADGPPGSSATAGGSAGSDAARAPATAGRSRWPVVFAVIVGALIGAGSAALVYRQLSTSGTTGSAGADAGVLAALSSRVDALEKRPDPQAALTTMKSQIGQLGERVAALDKRVGTAPLSPTVSTATPPPAPAASAGNTSATPVAASGQPSPTDTFALVAKVSALQASVDGLQKQTGSSGDLVGKVAALQDALTSARTNVDALKGQQQDLDSKLGALQTSVTGVQQQASAAQSGVESVRTEQKTLAGKLGAPALAVVADSLVEQIDHGKPYGMQVDALASLGADPAKVAVLRQNATSGVPSAQTLLAKFQPLADAVAATGSKAPANAGFGERLKHGLLGLVSVRRTDEITGNDLPSRVALIQADLAHDDVQSAYGVWMALPADAKAKSDAWGALAKTSVEAIAAARGLQTDSIGSLAQKRS